MLETLRCRCGYVLERPKSEWEATNRTCPGCGCTLDYLYRTEENEARIRAEISTATQRTYVPMHYWLLGWIGIWVAVATGAAAVGPVMGWTVPPTWWTRVKMVMYMASLPLLNVIIGMGIVNALYMAFTKKAYVEDRVVFSRAGGLDLAYIFPMALGLLVFGYYWATWRGMVQGPVWRTPFGFLVTWIGAIAIGDLVMCGLMFKVFRRKPSRRSL